MDKFFCLMGSDNQISLVNLKVGESASVVGFCESIEYKTKRRLLEFGFVKGAKIVLLERSFLNDVLLLEINGFVLSVRKDVAKDVLCRREDS